MKNCIRRHITIIFLLYFVPTAVFSTGLSSGEFTNFQSFVNYLINTFLAPLVPFLIGVGVVMFLYGVFKYFTHSADAAKREEGRKMMVAGAIAIFIMITFWGFAKMLVTSFGF